MRKFYYYKDSGVVFLESVNASPPPSRINESGERVENVSESKGGYDEDLNIGCIKAEIPGKITIEKLYVENGSLKINENYENPSFTVPE